MERIKSPTKTKLQKERAKKGQVSVRNKKKWKGGTCYTTIKYTRSKES